MSARRVIASLLTALWLVALFGSVWHGAEDVHRYCEEHDTYEEAGQAPRPGAFAAAESSDRLLSAGAAESAEHHACPFLVFDAPATADEAAAPAVVAAHDSLPPAARAQDASPAAQIPLLAIAPKGSPPAAIASA
jgi:hypothetical protein